jgi:hypothetical protein
MESIMRKLMESMSSLYLSSYRDQKKKKKPRKQNKCNCCYCTRTLIFSNFCFFYFFLTTCSKKKEPAGHIEFPLERASEQASSGSWKSSTRSWRICFFAKKICKKHNC